MALHRLGTGRISHGFMALLKLAMMNIFTQDYLARLHEEHARLALSWSRVNARLII